MASMTLSSRSCRCCWCRTGQSGGPRRSGWPTVQLGAAAALEDPGLLSDDTGTPPSNTTSSPAGPSMKQVPCRIRICPPEGGAGLRLDADHLRGDHVGRRDLVDGGTVNWHAAAPGAPSSRMSQLPQGPADDSLVMPPQFAAKWHGPGRLHQVTCLARVHRNPRRGRISSPGHRELAAAPAGMPSLAGCRRGTDPLGIPGWCRYAQREPQDISPVN